jgi:hypothetical protein
MSFYQVAAMCLSAAGSLAAPQEGFRFAGC